MSELEIFDYMGMYLHPADFDHTSIDVDGLKALIEQDELLLDDLSECVGAKQSIDTSEWLLELHAKKLIWLEEQVWLKEQGQMWLLAQNKKRGCHD